MDIAKAFTFITEDEQWIGKIGIGAVMTILSIFIIPIPLLVGYSVGVTRNVLQGQPKPLPNWEDWGQLFQDGLAILVAQLVYTLPFWGLLCVASVATLGFGSMSERSEEAATAAMTATFGALICLSLLFLVALFFLSPAIVVQYVRSNTFSAPYRFGEVIAIARENLGEILIVFLATLVVGVLANLVIGILGMIPCIGWIAALLLSMGVGPYMAAAAGHLYGQIAARQSN